MKINKPIAGEAVRNLELHPNMTAVVVVADNDSAAILTWDGKLDRKTWAQLCNQEHNHWEILRGDEWIPMFPYLLVRTGLGYYLPACNCAPPSGTKEEWLTVIGALKNNTTSDSFTRLAMRREANGLVILWNPRNAQQWYDRVEILPQDLPEWIAQAEKELNKQ